MGLHTAEVYTMEVYCPVQRTNTHIPMHDCVRIMWKEKSVQFYCLACKQNHTVSLAHINN
jgi:hypothetical protein